MTSHYKNFKADLINSTGTKWDYIYGGYFSSVEPLESFWKLIDPILPERRKISIVELGSANANLCQFIDSKLQEKNVIVESMVVDAQEDSLSTIDINIKKVVADISEWQPNTFFDLILMRSVLHYNTIEDQVTILQNIATVMKKDSIFFNQLLSGDSSKIALYQEMQSSVFGRKIFLLNEDGYIRITMGIFKHVRKIGYCPPITVTAKDLLNRFSKTIVEREENWKNLQKIMNWKDEDESITLQFPVFYHKV